MALGCPGIIFADQAMRASRQIDDAGIPVVAKVEDLQRAGVMPATYHKGKAV